jgi:iron-sulfur cluster repair protein YtfE (RIC family)
MKRRAELQPLSHDHYNGLVVADRVKNGIARGGDQGEIRQYVLHFWRTALANHFQVEEDVLLPVLANPAGRPLAERLREEHAELTLIIGQLVMEEGSAGDLLSRFHEQLRQHIRFEERTLFPHIERHAPPASIEEIGRQLERDEPNVVVDWPIRFWE